MPRGRMSPSWCSGENPYAEGVGDRRNLLLRADGSTHLEILAKLNAEKIPVVAVFLSGRRYG